MFQESTLGFILEYTAKGMLDPNADHTDGTWVDTNPPFWDMENPPLRGAIYLSHSNHAVGQIASVFLLIVLDVRAKLHTETPVHSECILG